MKSVKALYGQNITDIAIQEYGTTEIVFDLAHFNDISLTQVLEPGQKIFIPENDLKRTETVRVIQANNIKPATQLTQKDMELLTLDISCCFCKYFK